MLTLDPTWALGGASPEDNDEGSSTIGMVGPSRGESKSSTEQKSSSPRENDSVAVTTVSGPQVRHEIDLLSGGVHLGTASFGVRISECLMSSHENPEVTAGS